MEYSSKYLKINGKKIERIHWTTEDLICKHYFVFLINGIVLNSDKTR